MQNRPPTCEGCPLHLTATPGFCPDKLVLNAAYDIYGEAPGKNELVQATPFVGDAGFVLRNWLMRAVPQIQLAEEKHKISYRNILHCLGYKTRVWMVDGSWKEINKVSPNEYVWSWDQHSIVAAKILAVTRTPNRRKWLQIDVDGAHRRNQCKNHGIYVTPDHEWVTPVGRVLAGQLKIGDPVYLPQSGSADFLHGTLLGDGHVRDQGILTVAHANREYAFEKGAHLGKVPKYGQHLDSFGSGKVLHKWTFTCTIPRKWREKFYRADRTKRWLPPISDAALAIFYCDDGTISKPRKPSHNQYAAFATQSFKRDFGLILEWFTKEFGDTVIDKAGNTRLSCKASKKLFERIAPYIPNSMQYKLPLSFQGLYNGWLQRRPPMLGYICDIKTCEYSEKFPFYKHSEMCLVIEGTHNFFTRCGLVSNCLPPMTQGRPYPKGKDRVEAEAHCAQYREPPTAPVVILCGEVPQRFWFKEELEAEDAADKQLGHDLKGVMGRIGRVYEKDGKRWVFAPHPAYILRQPALVEHGQQALKIAANTEVAVEPTYWPWDEAMEIVFD